MSGLCAECSNRGEFLEIRKRALEMDASLNKLYTDGVKFGGRTFLGRHYAHSRNILLTLNPRPNPNRRFSAGLLETNQHWEGEAKASRRNWTLARHLFRNLAASADWVSSAMTYMTDEFVVPWPSADWRSMEKSTAWPAIRQYSAELCRLSLRDHQPELVFVSGKTTLRLFFQFICISPPKAVDRRASRNKSWNCEWFRLDHDSIPGILESPTNVVRLPHFSRGSYREFEEIGKWVADAMPDPILVNVNRG